MSVAVRAAGAPGTVVKVAPPSVDFSRMKLVVASVPYKAAFTVTTPAPVGLSKSMRMKPARIRADFKPLNLSADKVPVRASEKVQIPLAKPTVSTAKPPLLPFSIFSKAPAVLGLLTMKVRLFEVPPALVTVTGKLPAVAKAVDGIATTSEVAVLLVWV